MNAKSSELKRCAVCRRWYHPSVKAVSFQKTCSESCRKIRNRRLGRSRRERNLQDYRVDERARQRACRHRKKKKAGESAGSYSMSRAGLPPHAIDIHAVVRESVDSALEKSRATLIRQLTAWLKDNTPILGQSYAVQATCHAPACSDK
jgi:transposase